MVVCDAGADFGCSPYWFIKHGVSKVIAFESNPIWNAQMKQLAYGDPRVIIHDTWDGSYYPADILKVDVDGPETLLTEPVLERYSQWAIAIHSFIDPKEYR